MRGSNRLPICTAIFMGALLIYRKLGSYLKHKGLALRTTLDKQDQTVSHKTCIHVEPGATAFESEGPHVPVGMLRRLNSIAMHTSRRNHHHDDVSAEATASGTDSGTADGVTPSTRYNNSSDADTRRAPASGGSPESNEPSTPGWRRDNTGHQRGHHPADDTHDGGAGGVRPTVMSADQGGR